MEDRVDKIINNMLKINKDNLNRDKIKLLIQEIKLALHKNKKTLLETYEVDKKNKINRNKYLKINNKLVLYSIL